jgi:hypothetical protein
MQDAIMAIDNSSQVALGANVATQLYGVTGAGLKIGIISDSYNALGGAAQDVANGDLPAGVTVLSDNDGTDEGRAMMQLAYSIAPGAQYYFATGDEPGGATTIASFAAAVAALQAAGCNIIVDDLGVAQDEGYYQTGTALDVAITNAVNAGVSYFSAAGNDGTGFYEQGFAPLSVSTPGIGGGGPVVANDFGGGNPYLAVTIPTTTAADPKTTRVYIAWAQPLATIGSGSGGAANSLAAYLLNASGQVVASSAVNLVGQNPFLELDYANTTSSTAFSIVIVQNGGTVPAGQLFKIVPAIGGLSFDNPDADVGSGNIYGHELLADTNVVGAVNYAATPAFGAAPPVPASFSSTGPGTILFDSQGNPLPTPVDVNLPSFLSAQGSNTTVPDYQPFLGTSAAAPTAAAVGALVLQADTQLTPAQVTSVLSQSAIPAVSSSANTGAGLIQARAAVEVAAAYAGNRFTASAGGDWGAAGNWSAGLPTAAQAISLDDDLGALTGSYTVAVDSAGQAAGSLAVAAPAGLAVTLSIAAGGGLAVGGPATADITADDFLLALNGVLAMTGGTLVIARTLNINAGTATIAGGAATAGDVALTDGSLTLGGGAAPADLTLATGFAQTGGTTSVLASGTLDVAGGGTFNGAASFTDAGRFVATGTLDLDSTYATILAGGTLAAASLSVEATLSGYTGTLADDGTIADAGGLTAAGAASGSITLADGGDLSIGAGASSVAIGFGAGGGTLTFATSDSGILTTGLTATLSGLYNAGSAVDFTGLVYSGTDSYAYAAGALTILDTAEDATLARLSLNPADGYSQFAVTPDDGTGILVTAIACFRQGTRLQTAAGPVAVEALKVGDRLATVSGETRPVTWIGHRRVDCRRHPSPARVWPVLVRKGAFGAAPRTDLFLSPDHAIFADGMLVPVHALLNGATIVQQSCDVAVYWHVELPRHDVVLAEGLPCESYLDTGGRALFTPGAALAPPQGDAVAWAWEGSGYAPLTIAGAALARLRERLRPQAPSRPRRTATMPRNSAQARAAKAGSPCVAASIARPASGGPISAPTPHMMPMMA